MAGGRVAPPLLVAATLLLLAMQVLAAGEYGRLGAVERNGGINFQVVHDRDMPEAPPAQEADPADFIQAHLDPQTKRTYYYDTRTGQSTWEDPRIRTPVGGSAPAQGSAVDKSYDHKDNSTVWAVVTIPFLTFVALMGARIYYLYTNYPELLFASKKRKDRKKGWSRGSQPKQRGKLNQGKGG